MTKKILVAGVLGGVVLFLWGSISHLVLPLGEIGIKTIPNEAGVMAAMRANLSERGFYFFPGYEQTPDMSDEERQAVVREWQEKYEAGPIGILIYNPRGRKALSLGQLLTELLSDVLAALVAAFLLAQAAPTLAAYGVRVLFVVLLAVFAVLNTTMAYWNWYSFPTDYTLATIADEVIGWALAGAALAALLKPKAS